MRLFAGGKVDGSKGFTLLEVLITVAIVSILGVISAPNFMKAYQRIKFEMVAQKAYAFLHHSYNYTLTKRKQYLLYVEMAKQELVLKLEDEKDEKKFILSPEYRMEADVELIELGYEGSFLLYARKDDPQDHCKLTGYLKIINEKNNWEARIDFFSYWGGIILTKL